MQKLSCILVLLSYSFFCSGQCPTPNGLFTTNITFNTALANWSPVTGVDHYKIRYKILGTTNWSNLGNIGASDSTRNIPLLQQATTYEWEIMAFCDSTNQLGSLWSINDTFTTLSFTPAIFNPLVINTLSTLQCNAQPQLSIRVSQMANEPDIETSIITSNAGSFDINSMNAGDSVGFAIMTTSNQTIYASLKVGIIPTSNYAIINSIDSSGSIMGFFTIENASNGIKITSISPNDGNNYTSGYISELHFTSHFVNPPSAGPLNFYSDILSELTDQVYDTSTFIISCTSSLINESCSKKRLLNIYTLLGQPCDKIEKSKLLIYYYSDGTYEKKIVL